MAKRKTIRYQVRCPVDSGPWLCVDGEYAAHDSDAAQLVAKVIGFASEFDWPLPPWSKRPSERTIAWYTALCYRIRGEFGAKEQTITVQRET